MILKKIHYDVYYAHDRGCDYDYEYDYDYATHLDAYDYHDLIDLYWDNLGRNDLFYLI